MRISPWPHWSASPEPTARSSPITSVIRPVLLTALIESAVPEPRCGSGRRDQNDVQGRRAHRAVPRLAGEGFGERSREPHALRAAAARPARSGSAGALRRASTGSTARSTPTVWVPPRSSSARMKLEALAAVSIAVVEGLGIQRALDPDGFDHARAWCAWRAVLGRYLALSERSATSRRTRRLTPGS